MRHAVILVFVLACSCIPPVPGGGSSSSSSSSGGGNSSSTTLAPKPAACTPLCTSAMDCGGGTPQNFQCKQGACFYAGCMSDTECNGGADGGPRCTPAVEGVRSCRQPCTAPTDCQGDGSGPFGWACLGGFCQPGGCSSDADCPVNGDHPDAGRTCVVQRGLLGGITTRGCALRCNTPADCGDQAGVHYACTGGACVFLGCQSDSECVPEGNAQLVCR